VNASQAAYCRHALVASGFGRTVVDDLERR
jgi:hypothetical protein